MRRTTYNNPSTAFLVLVIAVLALTQQQHQGALIFVEAGGLGATRVRTSETCWGCWGRGSLDLYWPDCSCICNLPTDRVVNNSAKYLRLNLGINSDEDPDSQYLTLLKPSCRYLSSERVVFDALFQVPTFEVIPAQFRRQVLLYLELFNEDQYEFHSLTNSTTTEGYSVLRFDIRDDGTGNNFSAATLENRTPLEIVEHLLTGGESLDIILGSDLVSVAVAVTEVAPVFNNPLIGQVQGYPIYVETGYFFLGAILFTCLLCLLEAALGDNVAGDGMTMKEWMVSRGKGLPDGYGVNPWRTPAGNDDASDMPMFADGHQSGWGVGELDSPRGGEGEAGGSSDDDDDSPTKNKKSNAAGGFADDDDDMESAVKSDPVSGRMRRKNSKKAWGADDDGQGEDPQSDGDGEVSSVREDQESEEMSRKRSRLGSKYFM